MANINDFKLVNNKASKYYEFLNLKNNNSDDFYKNKLGFYLYILECVTNNTDLETLKNCIIDTEFRKDVFNEKNDDLGIDAVYIDEDNLHIQLFNFKFRQNFKRNKGQEGRSVSDTHRFMSVIETEDIDNLDETTKNCIETILNKLSSNATWKMTLYFVSNENLKLNKDEYLKNFSEVFDLNIESITLDDIVDYMSEKQEDINASLVVPANTVMPYKENELNSNDSYLIKLSLDNLMKITCNDEEIRNDSEGFEIEEKPNMIFEPMILNDNVRGFLGETKYNNKIISTIKNEPGNFFLYNNGVTIIANEINAELINSKKMFKCSLKGINIVNGGQTVKSIYKYYNDDDNDVNNLLDSYILIRFISTGENEFLKNNVAEYTNSQNPISVFDIKAINNLQIEIERYLKENDILYVRKAGDTGKQSEHYKYRISKEVVAQILYAVMGHPDKSTNQKKALFSNLYDEIFNEKLLYDDIIKYVLMYFEIESTYKDTAYNGFNSKYLYILYIKNNFKKKSYNECIELLEKVIRSYKKDEQNLSDARKLIQKAFKNSLDKELESK